jgi:hypothetical protein
MHLVVVFAISLIITLRWLFSEEYDIREELRDRMFDVYSYYEYDSVDLIYNLVHLYTGIKN